MPRIYLSPSTQEYNPYVTGNGSEEYFMNLVADAMEPYLLANGIQFSLNTPDMTAASSIRQANRGDYDFYLALHSNASGPGSQGQNRGIIAFYYPTSRQGKRAATIIADGLKAIYPLPNLVRAEATTAIGEVRRTRAPSVLLELAFHDNAADAAWIKNNLDSVARNLVLSLTEYFNIPFFEQEHLRSAVVDVDWGALNLRAQPSQDAPVLTQIPDGAALTLRNQYQNWYLTEYNGITGYIDGRYASLN